MSITSQDETTRSRPHRRVEMILDGMGVPYQSEHDEFQPYSLDIFINKCWGAIEIDGPTHSKTKDKKRDDVLLGGFGIKVLHIKASGVTVEDVKQRVRRFIAECEPTAQERRRICEAD